nr:SDR family NAD(P)-dependent oxidoreductase [Aminobacter sp. HY435]
MDGHNVIITGGARRRIAKTLSGTGAKVMIANLNGEMAVETAAGIQQETGNECHGMTCDVTSLTGIQSVVDGTANAFGGISVAEVEAGNPGDAPARRDDQLRGR